MTWVAVAIGGSALLGAGASYIGSKKQADASKDAAGLNQRFFEITNRQQQPFIQSGYSSLGRLNTLLGLNPRSRSGTSFVGTPSGGVKTIQPISPGMQTQGIGQGIAQNQRLRGLLMLRAQRGDTQAGEMLNYLG